MFLFTLSSCTTVSKNISENKTQLKGSHLKLPLFINYIKPEPIDTIQDFTKTYFRFKKIEVISRDDQLALIKASAEKVGRELFSEGFTTPEDMARKSFERIETVSGTLNLRFFLYDQAIDSVQWSFSYFPPNKNNINRRHTFIPQNKPLFSALKEFTDTLIASPDYK